MGLSVDINKNLLFVSNWYDNLVSVIDINKKKIIKEIKVGKSPAGIYLDQNSKRQRDRWASKVTTWKYVKGKTP